MARSKFRPDLYVANVRKYLDLASPEDIALGRDWYPTARRMVDAIAQRTGIAPERVAAMVAALSPRNPWKWNVQDAAAFAHAIANGLPMPPATTFGANRRTAWALGTGAADWRGAAPKVRSFVANIMGDEQAVTVDVWATRVATDGAESEANSNVAKYNAMAEAYRIVARERGMAPREVQAITWLVAERLGVGSKRRGRHSETFKRGTFGWIVALF